MTNTNENPLDITLDSIGKVGGIIIGIDIGSTTAKLAVFEGGKLIYQRYERHFSQVRQKTLEMIKAIEPLLDGKQIRVAIAGSAGMGMANAANLPFVQEVFATGETVKALAPETSTVIELGGEDAKVIFLKGGTDERMNGSCAGGTGAFIDQMATLLDVTNEEMDKLSLEHKRIFPIASRCGVFAKTDIQPLLNQGAAKSDIAASIYQAVVNQTIAGLAQGRKIEGNVMFLGGPLHYCMGLRERFVKTLKLADDEANFPDYALYAVSIGAALIAAKQTESYSYDELISRLENAVSTGSSTTILN
ncbi:MAG: acyl-CoA dehydratase activase, partial [Acutalibacteraceae bacterium]|nr:acyl-CoA dehydratase activase [Acutalibacteraceae bacterium]